MQIGGGEAGIGHQLIPPGTLKRSSFQPTIESVLIHRENLLECQVHR
jgi:hypothetical protein